MYNVNKKLRAWRKGSRESFKNFWEKSRAGSIPAARTRENNEG